MHINIDDAVIDALGIVRRVAVLVINGGRVELRRESNAAREIVHGHFLIHFTLLNCQGALAHLDVVERSSKTVRVRQRGAK